MSGRRQKNSFLAVHFLQLQIRRKQIPISDLAFLQQFLNSDLRARIGDSWYVGHGRKLHDQPIGFRHPVDRGGGFLVAAR